MRSWRSYGGLFAVAAAALAACAGKKDAAPNYDGPWASLAERPCPPGNVVGYDNFGGPFMLTYCTGCHSSDLQGDLRRGAPPDVNFDTLGDIRKRAARIWTRAADGNATMPPAGSPKELERRRLGEWLACGAPGTHDGIITGTSGAGGAAGSATGAGGGVACKDTPSCSSCRDCAAASSCSAEVQACEMSASCSALAGCTQGCAGNDAKCQQNCATLHGGGQALYDKLAKCLLCGECKTICSAQASCQSP